MRFLVTGAGGFIGRALLRRLAEEPECGLSALARASDLQPAGTDSPLPLPEGVQVYDVDVRDAGAVASAITAIEPEIVFHLAAAGVADPFLPLEVALEHNLYGTLHLVQAVFSTAGSDRPASLVIARTPGERSAMNPYAASKAAAWQLCRMFARQHGWPIRGAMIFQAYGSGQNIQSLVPSALRAALAGHDFPMTAGEQLRDWIHVADVVEGLLAVAQASLPPATTVELGTGELTSVLDVVRLLYELVGGAGCPLPGALPTRPGEEDVQVATAAETQALTGWRARRSLREGLAMLVQDEQDAQPRNFPAQEG